MEISLEEGSWVKKKKKFRYVFFIIQIIIFVYILYGYKDIGVSLILVNIVFFFVVIIN